MNHTEGRSRVFSEGLAAGRPNSGIQILYEMRGSSCKSRKRQRLHSPVASPKASKHKSASSHLATELYPNYHRPTPQECRSVRDELLALHGFPPEFARFRRKRPFLETEIPQPLNEHDFAQEDSVLDGLVSTLLSQNTTESNSAKAFASLKVAFPTWEDVLAAETKLVENSIKCGGLAATKALCIKNILSYLLEKRGKICLEYLRGLSIDEVKAELSTFKGIGPKTIACVLMFHLQFDDFPVDTHVYRITKAIGWVPREADREKAYLHLNRQIPNELKFDLNCLFVTHGKLCQNCAGKNSNRCGTRHHSCPLSNYLGSP